MNQILVLAELFIAKGVSLRRWRAEVLLYLIPSLLAFAVPMAVLMGILAGLSRLSTDSEIVGLPDARHQLPAAGLARLRLRLRRVAPDVLS